MRRLRLTSERKSIAYFQSARLQREKDPWNGLYSHMFIEDVKYNIMPIGGESKTHPEFDVILEPSKSDNEDVLRVAFSTDGDVKSTLREATSRFITDCAMQLAYQGETHYEIVRGDPKEFQDGITFRHVKLPIDASNLCQPLYICGDVLRIPGYYFQIVPRAEWGSQKKVFVLISANSVLSIKLPSQLGSRSSHAKLLKTLMKYGMPLPKFVNYDPKGDSTQRNFSFSDFHLYTDLRIAMESALWGWPARQLWEKRILEYYLVYRNLRFARSMAILREHILLSINNLLQRTSIQGQLVIKGLPTSDTLQEALSQLESGNISFDDVLNLTNLQ